MSYKQEKVESITVRITRGQRDMLDEMTKDYNAYLSDVVRGIFEQERKRRKKAAESMVPPRRR